jgi:multiple sugar transport system permease protein
MGIGTTRRVRLTIVYLLLVLISAVFLFPIYHVVMTSFKFPVDAFRVPPKWIFQPTLQHHLRIWVKEPFVRYLVNTLVIAFGTVGISVPIASLAAYGFVRQPGRQAVVFAILLVLLAIRMFPQMLLVIPYFMIAKTLRLQDTRIIMILIMVAFNQPFAIWLMRGFFISVPRELDEAAVIDGCSRVGALIRVILPVVTPGIATTAIFSFLLAYNNFLFPLILTGTRAKTLPVAIAEYGAENIQYWSISAAGVTGVIVPIIIIMLFLQKHFVRGLTSGALK